MSHFSIFEPGPLKSILAVLNTARQGVKGGSTSAAVHASSKGFRITLNGVTIAKGSTPRELQQAFDARVAAARRNEKGGAL